jgi:hypothetical protein
LLKPGPVKQAGDRLRRARAAAQRLGLHESFAATWPRCVTGSRT